MELDVVSGSGGCGGGCGGGGGGGSSGGGCCGGGGSGSGGGALTAQPQRPLDTICARPLSLAASPGLARPSLTRIPASPLDVSDVFMGKYFGTSRVSFN